jgi:23S rRNA-/tRNA-specific pseudouridylate synthase
MSSSSGTTTTAEIVTSLVDLAVEPMSRIAHDRMDLAEVIVDDDDDDSKSRKVEATAVVDSPCWGSPENCSLIYLLDKLSVNPSDFSSSSSSSPSSNLPHPNSWRERAYRRLVLYDDGQDFIALNKPPDLRMDGPFPATLHKLLLFLFPTPSLRQAAAAGTAHTSGTSSTSTSTSTATTTTTGPDNDYQLLQFLQNGSVHQHKDTSDHKLAARPCHQLDYATSGLLWVARTPAAAHLAATAFEERRVDKTYTALVHGHLGLSSSSSSFTSCCPVLSRQYVQDWLANTEESYRKERGKRRPETFQGFLPPHALLLMYQGQQLQTREDAQPSESSSNNDFKKRRRRHRHSYFLLNEEEWKVVWKPLLDGLDQASLDLLVVKDWKTLKASSPVIMSCLNEVCQIYNQLARDKKKDTNGICPEETDEEAVPIMFRVAEELGEDHFYVAAPLARVDHEFSMRLPPTCWAQCNPMVVGNNNKDNLPVGTDDLDYKPSLTKCTIVQRAIWHDGGFPVNKVLLEPKTGRRHQLRVHMALTGHAILGDGTY